MSASLPYNPLPPRPRWGIRVEPHKQLSTSRPIRTAPLPARVHIPLDLGPGRVARALVQADEPVLTGQPIARMPTPGGNTIRAPITGRVAAIEASPVPAAGGQLARCIVIDNDGADRWDPGCLQPADPSPMTPAQLRERIAGAGIRGLGGALYPTATKLEGLAAVELLILNGAECEPYISCDEMLMRERADAVVDGARIMLQALGCAHAVVAVESDMPAARAALVAALQAAPDERIGIAEVTAKYPAGGERQLVELLTGREVPAGGLPRDVGMLCQNVATAAAVSDLFRAGRPLISRIVTVTGSGVREPVNVEARLGTPLSDLVAAAGGYTEDGCHLVMGGPMMGVELDGDGLPMTEATNCLLVMRPGDLPAPQPALPCIRCAECSRVCPARLLPQELLAACEADHPERLAALHLDACIECGCCDYVCPSHIELTPRFTLAKQRQRARGQASERALHWRRRSEARDARLAERGRRIADGPRDQAEAQAALAELMDRVTGDERGNDG